MTLSEAVRGANTPEELTRIFEVIARRYVVARSEEKKFNLAKGEIRDACVEALKKLETDAYEWVVKVPDPSHPAVPDVETKFRAKVYSINRVKPTQRLVDLLRARGLGDLVKTEVKIDDAGLYRAVRLGLMGIEEIRTNSEISTGQGFRITELKPGKEEEVDE